jgi:hypothetical protein
MYLNQLEILFISQLAVPKIPKVLFKIHESGAKSQSIFSNTTMHMPDFKHMDKAYYDMYSYGIICYCGECITCG